MRHRFLLLALVLPLAVACSDDSAGDASTPASAGTTPAVAAASNEVGITDFKFGPPSIEVAVGGSLVWTNNDDQQHTATSAGNFDAGAIQPGAVVDRGVPDSRDLRLHLLVPSLHDRHRRRCLTRRSRSYPVTSLFHPQGETHAHHHPSLPIARRRRRRTSPTWDEELRRGDGRGASHPVPVAAGPRRVSTIRPSPGTPRAWSSRPSLRTPLLHRC